MKEWIIPYLKKNKGWIVIVLFLGLGTAMASALLMFTSGFLISKAATRPENILLIYVPIVAVRTFGISKAVFRYLERLVGHHIVLTILSQMRKRVYQAVEPLVGKQSFSLKIGDMLGLLSEDVERLQDIYIKTVFPTVVGYVLYGFVITALGYFSLTFAFIMSLLLGILVFLFPWLSLSFSKYRVEKVKNGRHGLYSKLTDAVLGLSDWQFSGRANDFIKSYEEEEAKLASLEEKNSGYIQRRNLTVQLLIATIVVLMLVWSAQESAMGELQPTLIAAFVLVLFPLMEIFIPISDSVSEIPSYQASLKRLNELPSNDSVMDHQLSLIEIDKQIEIKQASFGYEKERWIINDLSLSIKEGEKIALLGPSGGGKSTIVKLIIGDLSPQKGSVCMNGIETHYLGEHISKVVSVLNQDPYLFSTTVKNNIRLGCPEASDEEIFWAAKQVKLHEFILSLPEGYDTIMDEAGTRFSGGERHRIALARILLQAAPFVILDEPTVGLDPLTEKALVDTIFEVLQNKSVLWITHHLAFIEKADRVLFLENGKLALEGTHEHLIHDNQRYRALYQLS